MKKRKARELHITALAAVLVTVQPALGGPDKTTEYLMNTPPSILDFGIYKLGVSLSERFESIYEGAPNRSTVWPSVSYDWNSDSIVINGYLFNPTETELDTSEDICAEFIEAIRLYALVNPKTGELSFDDRQWSAYSAVFNHSGYTNDQIKEALKELDNKFLIKCQIGFGDGTPVYQAPLMGNSYVIQNSPSE